MPEAPPRTGRLAALLRQRCPSCREGRIFRGQFAMNLYCPVCELRLHREPGYTTVAIEISYLFSVPLLVLAIGIVWLATRWPLEWTLVSGSLLYVPVSPAVFRYSRTLWIYLDRAFDPGPLRVPDAFTGAFQESESNPPSNR